MVLEDFELIDFVGEIVFDFCFFFFGSFLKFFLNVLVLGVLLDWFIFVFCCEVV